MHAHESAHYEDVFDQWKHIITRETDGTAIGVHSVCCRIYPGRNRNHPTSHIATLVEDHSQYWCVFLWPVHLPSFSLLLDPTNHILYAMIKEGDPRTLLSRNQLEEHVRQLLFPCIAREISDRPRHLIYQLRANRNQILPYIQLFGGNYEFTTFRIFQCSAGNRGWEELHHDSAPLRTDVCMHISPLITRMFLSNGNISKNTKGMARESGYILFPIEYALGRILMHFDFPVRLL